MNTYKTDAEYYFEVNGVEGEFVLVLEFDDQRAERATYWEPGNGAGLTLCNVTMKDGSPIDPMFAKDIDVWAQEYLDDNTRYIVDHEILTGREY
jgi:hypothetical protein